MVVIAVGFYFVNSIVTTGIMTKKGNLYVSFEYAKKSLAS
jgi:hypothetical protein